MWIFLWWGSLQVLLSHIKSQDSHLRWVYLFALYEQSVTLDCRAVKNGEISAGVRSLLFHLALVMADTGLVPALSLPQKDHAEGWTFAFHTCQHVHTSVLYFRIGPVQWGLSAFQGRLVEDTLWNPDLPSCSSKDCCNSCNPNSSCIPCKKKIKASSLDRYSLNSFRREKKMVKMFWGEKKAK